MLSKMCLKKIIGTLLLFIQSVQGQSSTHFRKDLELLGPGKIFDSENPNDVWSRWENDRNVKDGFEDEKYVRLPMEVEPYHYFLELTPILEENAAYLGRQWTAPGLVKILTKALKSERTLTLNALGLNVTSVKINCKSTGNAVGVMSHNYSNVSNYQYVINLLEPLKVGKRYEIVIDFVAPISLDSPDGLYRSEYTDSETKKTKYLVSTQLEFFHARQVFPCFDEPGVKSTFDISIRRSSNYTALSNSNLISSIPLEEASGWFTDKFNTTPKMSTYLVAIVVSDFDYSEADLSIYKNKPVRVYASKESIENKAGEYGANFSAHILSYYENYFDLEYPMPKMDSASVPGFYYGNFATAMENYGLNIYKESVLLYTPGVTSETARLRTSLVIAHESAHQYFGNIVTCKWWNNIWLQEGFATYYSYIGLEAMNPEFEGEKLLLRDGPQQAFLLDSKESRSYPLLLNAKTQRQFNRQVLGLPYYKGASLIRMMNYFLTPKTFQRGIKRYLSTWAHSSTEQDDLFESLTQQAHEDGTLSANISVKNLMDPWTKQRGFPLVRVISSDEDTVYVLYEKFSSPNIVKNSDQAWWPIPVNFVTQSDPDFENHYPKFWIQEGSVVRTIKHDTTKWIIVNPETTAYYRVVYDKKLTSLLHYQFNRDFTVISPMTRSQILDDYFTLGIQKDLPIHQALKFTNHLGNETELIVWGVVQRHLLRIFYFYQENATSHESMPHFKGFQNYFVDRLEGALRKIGIMQLPGESGNKVILRKQLLNWACKLESKDCLSYADSLFDLWKADPSQNPIPTDLREFMYCYGVASGGVTSWLFAYERMSNDKIDANTRGAILQSLGCVKEEGLLTAVLESLLEENGIFKTHEAQILLLAVIDNPIGRGVVLDFLKRQIPKLKEVYGSNFNYLLRWTFLKFSVTLHTEEELMKIQELLELHSLTIGANNLLPLLSLYVADIGSNIVWMKKHYEPMQIWFDAQISK